MEIEIGWKLALTLVFLGVCALGIVKAIWEDDTTIDLRAINEAGKDNKN